MDKINFKEFSEVGTEKPEKFKEIRSENGTTGEGAKKFWEGEFKKEADYYTSYEDRLACTPKETSNAGSWEGKRGESKFIPNAETPEGKSALDKLEQKGLNGIEYKNGEPDFSKGSEATVKIENMTENRNDYRGQDGDIRQGNFTQADIKCAEKWNEEGKDNKTNWTARDVCNWRHENKCSWHERCDTKTMDLVPTEVHSLCKHSGGVAACKVRDALEQGGKFDE